MNKILYQFFVFWAASFVCLYLAFSPTTHLQYTCHDSIRYFHKLYNKDNSRLTGPQYQYEYELGRPVTAEIEEYFYKKVDHLSDMSRLRLMTILVFSLSSSLLAMAAVYAGMGSIPAFCLSVAIFTLPGVQDFIFVPYLANALAVLLSLLSNVMLRSKIKYGMQYIFSFILLEISFCLYPPSTFFFLLPVSLMMIFGDDWKNSRSTLMRDVFMWGLAAGSYFLVLRLLFYGQMKSSGHEIAFTGQQLIVNIMTYFSQGLPQILNLWNVYYSKDLAMGMIILFTLFAAINVFVFKRIAWERVFSLVFLFLLQSLVWFFFGGYQPREFITVQALVLALVYWGGKSLGDIWRSKREVLLPVWAGLILCAGLFIANKMITSNVLNNYSELMFVRSRLVQFVDSATKEIHFINLKDATNGYDGLPRVYDNLNSVTPDYEKPDLVRAALTDMGDPFQLHCIVTYSDYGEPFKTLPNAVIIDMNDLVEIEPKNVY